MKGITVTFLCIFGYINAMNDNLAREMKNKVQTFAMQCIESEHATEADMEALINQQMPRTHAGRCVLFCTAKKFNVMNEDGTIGEGDPEWMERLKKDDLDTYTKMIAISKKCGEHLENEPDYCDRALKYTLCGYDEFLKNGLEILM